MPYFQCFSIFFHPEGFSHLGFGGCVSTAGCMIRPGRLVILASSGERYDIYFSNPWPWGWKMHVSSLAKAVWVIIYASVSSPMSRPTGWVSDRWCTMSSSPSPSFLPEHVSQTTTGHFNSVLSLISTCQAQTLTSSQLTILSSFLPPASFTLRSLRLFLLQPNF